MVLDRPKKNFIFFTRLRRYLSQAVNLSHSWKNIYPLYTALTPLYYNLYCFSSFLSLTHFSSSLLQFFIFLMKNTPPLLKSKHHSSVSASFFFLLECTDLANSVCVKNRYVGGSNRNSYWSRCKMQPNWKKPPSGC